MLWGNGAADAEADVYVEADTDANADANDNDDNNDDAEFGECCEELGRLCGGMRHPSTSLSISKGARVGMEPHVCEFIWSPMR